MNSTNKNKTQINFNSDLNLSRKEIEHYLSNIDEQEKNAIEKKSQSSAFESDALDGWSESGASMSDLNSLDRKFIKKTNYVIPTALVLGIAGLIVFSLYYFNKNENLREEKFASHAEKQKITIERTDLNIPEKIDTMVKLPSNETIKAKLIQETFEAKISTDENIKSTQNHSISPLQVADLPLLKLDNPKKAPVKTSITAKEIYLSDLKLVDYRAYRSKPEIKSERVTLYGTPANQEGDQLEDDIEQSWKQVNVPYIDYLRKTQEIFAKEDYKKALTRYLIILETYPDDINALFYSGLCYYNLQQFQSATAQFYNCLGSKYDNFNEEAEWFLAKSYHADGQKQKAQSIYQLIIEKSGYYSDQAKKEVNK